MEAEDGLRQFKLETSEEEARCLSRMYCHLLHRSPGPDREGGSTVLLAPIHSALYGGPRREDWNTGP